MLGYRLWLSELIYFCFHEVLVAFCCASLNWIDTSRMSICLSLPDGYLGSWSIVCPFIGFAAPCKLLVIFQFVRTITLDVFGPLNSVQKCRVAPPPTILVLGDSWVHVCSSNGSDVVAYIEVSVDKHFSIADTLYIPYINPDDCHIGFWKDFDDLRLQYQSDVVENMVVLEDAFDHT